MFLYTLISVVVIVTTIILNLLFSSYGVDNIILSVIIYVFLSILFDALVALIRKVVPEKYIDKNYKIYHLSRGQKVFYELIQIKKWKDLVPELGGKFTSLSKSKVEQPHNEDYLKEFIIECKYGIIIHTLSLITAFLPFICDFNLYIGNYFALLTIGLPICLTNAILIYAPALILRYNLPRIEYLYKINLRKNVKHEDIQ